MTIFKKKSILITGGTGSFGKNFAKFLLQNTELNKLIILSRDEFKQHCLKQEFADERVRFFIGDARDLPRLQRALQGVDIVVHAAALKQVPALEYDPFEAIKTNIIGTQNVIEAAIDQEVSRVLLISTDKAAEPVNLYGATKLCAEKLCISANAYSPNKTKFSVVRYGNVLGSRGSIVETLQKNKDIKKVQITDPRMTRFWITLEQSCDLVVSALESMEGGEIFIPKIPSMKIVDLFDALAPQAEKEIVGIRPGEKLHEVLLTTNEAPQTVELEKYFVVLPQTRPHKTFYEKYKNQGKPVEADFVFASNTNRKQLTSDELKTIMKKSLL